MTNLKPEEAEKYFAELDVEIDKCSKERGHVWRWVTSVTPCSKAQHKTQRFPDGIDYFNCETCIKHTYLDCYYCPARLDAPALP